MLHEAVLDLRVVVRWVHHNLQHRWQRRLSKLDQRSNRRWTAMSRPTERRNGPRIARLRNSGSKVAGARLFGCSPDATAIPWLLLEAVSTSGPGIYSSVTYIQRLNTTGGLAPAGPGSFIGETVQIPYTAEYYFYREQ